MLRDFDTFMRMKTLFFTLLALLCVPLIVCAQNDTSVLRASTVLDGKGGVQHNVDIAIRGGKIERIGPAQANAMSVYDLQGLTVLPGLIDTHVHIAWHLGPDGRYQPRDTSQVTAMGYAMENAWVTLNAGFTTIQSLGSPIDKDLRDAILRGVLPGPRVLTSIRPISNPNWSLDQIRENVNNIVAEGGDVIKIFASAGSVANGGRQTLSNEQIAAACQAAKQAGVRAIVHAYGDATIRAVSDGGCTSVEHGFFATDDTLRMLAAKGTYFDPNVGLVMQNYLDNWSKFAGVGGGYSEDERHEMELAIPKTLDTFRRATSIPGLKIIFGTDAVAAAHGRNIEELVYRVNKGGQDTNSAIVSITSLAAESLGLANKIGTLTAGMNADIIAVDGDPLKDITALRRVVFVMKDGKVYKNR
jgi:imidazolonepropionase-like amidohydrolase